MYEQPTPISRPWRRYLRFNVRGLIVVVLVIGAGLGWVVSEAHVQRDAVAAIRRAGCSVMYSWEWSDGKLIPRVGKRRRALKKRAGLWISLELTISGMPPLFDVPLSRDATLADVEASYPTTVTLCQLAVPRRCGSTNLKGLTKLTRLDLLARGDRRRSAAPGRD